jgi:hypothetical protein
MAIAGAIITAQHVQKLDNLSFLIGKWKSDEVSYSQGRETPFVCHSDGQWVLRGRFVQLSERFELFGQRYENQFLLSEEGEAIRAWWFSSSSPLPVQFEGKASTKGMVLISQNPHLRLTFDRQTADHFLVRLESKADTSWQLMTKADYRRVKE